MCVVCFGPEEGLEDWTRKSLQKSPDLQRFFRDSKISRSPKRHWRGSEADAISLFPKQKVQRSINPNLYRSRLIRNAPDTSLYSKDLM